MEKEANTLSNYFRTDCPLTFHNITEIHPFWDRDLLWLWTSKRWQHPMRCWLLHPSRQSSPQRSHDCVTWKPVCRVGVRGGWRGYIAFCVSVLPESWGNSCTDCFKWIWKRFPFLFFFFFSWNLRPYVISFYEDHMGALRGFLVCSLKEEEFQLSGIPWDLIFNCLYLSS